MIREELINAWTNLKTKLTLYPSLLKNKELIKEALEFHANKSSEILSGRSSLMAQFQQVPKLANLSKEFKKEIDLSEIEQQPKPTTPWENPPGTSQPWKDYHISVRLRNQAGNWNGFFQQRQKNQQITENCKQLITKLTEF